MIFKKSIIKMKLSKIQSSIFHFIWLQAI